MSNNTSTVTTGDRSGIEVNTSRTYTGQGNLAVWLKKVDVWAALKGYSGEKNALAIASRLDGPAFECYARMSKEYQKDPAVVGDELKQEFVKAERDRGTATHELTGQSWREGESPASFAHDVCRLAKLAYPGFGADVLDTIARDCF